MSLTVIDVFKALRLEPDKALTWAVGDAMQRRYRETYGHEPPKELRPKTGGPGSHCFAIYPNNWRAEIEACIIGLGADAARQVDLFAERS